MAKFLMPILNEHKRDLKKNHNKLLDGEIISEYPDVLVDKHRLKRKKCAEL